ncbi:MAG: radical SAM protein [Ruminococcus sp.]|nr:radical SAM protein [Ruminococcus sp.]
MSVPYFDLQAYLTKGVEKIVAQSVKAVLKNPAESKFMAGFALSAKKASSYRREMEDKGEHIPPFLICSITNTYNLHCAGCYARANHACGGGNTDPQLTAEEWNDIFTQAGDMGISFILLAGGEPTTRRDIIKKAAEHKKILFPLFTNGVFIDDEYYRLFDKARNIVPIMSIEGSKETTDKRRGKGVYDRLNANMEQFKKKGLIFGASVTVTTKNMEEVTSYEFVEKLRSKGCKAVIYVEYVPVDGTDTDLAFEDSHRELFEERFSELRQNIDDMVLVSFPGDEKSSGGCIAAGRGFFHINSSGGAEPCPFSPYSDINVKDTSLREALNSKLFKYLQSEDVLLDEHKGGCVLFEKQDIVQALLSKA